MLRETQLDERRAATLMGVAPRDLRLLACQASLGQVQNGALVFTDDDLRRLSLLVARPGA